MQVILDNAVKIWFVLSKFDGSSTSLFSFVFPVSVVYENYLNSQ